jgi:hypothetical protein
MLITNFASGELSETLFGRTDIPQYFSGVSRLENFDVIPTGGIRRRGGMERLFQLPRAGRAIPFIVDRECCFILCMLPEAAGDPAKILVYKNGAEEMPALLNGTNGASLPDTMREISEAHYAQDYRTMVIAHENHKPTMICFAGGRLSVEALDVKISVEIIAGQEMENADKTPYFESDETYEKHGYLRREGDYPSCVTFFNGRLVFASTKNSRQRVFASRAGSYEDFSTYKKYLTEQREYVIVRGTVTGSADTIVVKDKETPLAFTKYIPSYVVESPFFEPGTRILEIFGDTIRVSKPSSIKPALDSAELGRLNQWKAQADAQINLLEDGGAAFEIGRPSNPYGSGTHYNPIFYMNAAVTRVRVNANGSYYYAITHAMARALLDIAGENPVGQAGRYLDGIFRPWLDSIAAGLVTNTIFDSPGNMYGYYQQARALLYSQVKNYWQYQVRDKTFFGTPDEIYQQAMDFYSQGTDAYIPFYSSAVLVDRHPTPDCGFAFEIASGMSDAIKWMAQNKALVIGTETAEWVVPKDADAMNVCAILNSRYGGDRIQAATVGDAAVFFQSGKKSLVEYYIPQQDNNFRANNMAMLSDRMLRESPAAGMDFISTPYAKIFIVREDGAAVALLYERGTGTFAWGRVATAGAMLSVASIPGPAGYDDIYLVVGREGGFFLEALREDSAVYLDSYRQWDGDAEGYAGNAVVYGEAEGKAFPLGGPLPPAGPGRWIGYPYASRARSMPVLANGRMKQNNIKSLSVRFLDSFMPDVKSLPNGKVDAIPHEEPYTGIWRIPFPGVWDHDAMFEFIHEKPGRCAILAINAEVN